MEGFWFEEGRTNMSPGNFEAGRKKKTCDRKIESQAGMALLSLWDGPKLIEIG